MWKSDSVCVSCARACCRNCAQLDCEEAMSSRNLWCVGREMRSDRVVFVLERGWLGWSSDVPLWGFAKTLLALNQFRQGSMKC